MVWLIKRSPGDETGATRAEQLRQRVSGLRAQAETEMARYYIELQHVRNSGTVSRATHVERILRVLELEIMTLERLGDAIGRYQARTPIRPCRESGPDSRLLR